MEDPHGPSIILIVSPLAHGCSAQKPQVGAYLENVIWTYHLIERCYDTNGEYLCSLLWVRDIVLSGEIASGLGEMIVDPFHADVSTSVVIDRLEQY